MFDETLSNVLSNLRLAYEQKKPFIFYRKPNELDVFEITQQDDSIRFLENFNQKGFVFAPFNSNEKAIFFPLDKSSFFKHSYKATSLNEINNNNFTNPSEKNKHVELVKKGIDFIKGKHASKIVLSRKKNIYVEQFDIVKTFENLLNKYTSAFVYVWYHPKIGLWLGATPETLVQTKNNNFKTMSLAGTQVYNNSLEVDWKSKELVEHQIVTNYIVSKLLAININCSVKDTETVKAGNLVHLKAVISGRLKNKFQLGDLIKALHPTPAICGVPKEIAKEFILKNESYKRLYYTGYLGELNFEKDNRKQKNNKRNIENHAYNFKETQSNLFVNLRCMEVQNKSLNIYVGGGITKDSNPEKEYLETVAKAEVMESVIV